MKLFISAFITTALCLFVQNHLSFSYWKWQVIAQYYATIFCIIHAVFIFAYAESIRECGDYYEKQGNVISNMLGSFLVLLASFVPLHISFH